VYSGAVTNTPSLGAAQQALTSFPGIAEERAALPALAYAVTYPLGIVGIIGSLLALKRLFRIDVAGEIAAHAAAEGRAEALERRTLVVENANLDGVPVGDVPGMIESGVVVSLIRRADEKEASVAASGTLLRTGDTLLVVGSGRGLDRFQRVVGRLSPESLVAAIGPVAQRQVVVTTTAVLGQTVKELNLEPQLGVVLTGVTRGDVQMAAVPALRLRFGDVAHIVGPEEALGQAASRLGDSVRSLNETHFVPLFAGISLGIALGMLPIACPGLPQPLRLGLAGGPLVVAIVVGRVGRIGRLVWHMPQNANLAFREFGIALFFAGVGLMAGPTFFSAACSLNGLLWLVAGACVTVAPLLAVGAFARTTLAMNYVDLSGLLAGSMTDPPALAFASGICQSESPAVAYATVYPLTMLLRIVTAQFLAVVLCGS
jgi:putative transport protein